MSEEILVYVGSYAGDKGGGIYVYRMDPSTGALEFTAKSEGVDNASFLTIGPQRRYLYAVNDTVPSADKPGGVVHAFSIAPGTGELTYLNQQPSHGATPCHLTVDQTGRFVIVANYREVGGAGSVSVLPIQDDGRLGEATEVIQHAGASAHPRRQTCSHPHSVTLDLSNRYAFVADLGIDKIMVYQLDLAQGRLKPNDEPWVQVKAGAGPRHFAFHPTGRYAYLINELDNTLIAFAHDETRGALREIQRAPALPAGFEGRSACADVHVAPSGRFLYGSNRGHDSIVTYAINEATGQLAYIGHEPTQGRTPRNFAIAPSGRFLLAANQDTNTIVTFRIDAQTGKLAATGHILHVPKPMCVQMCRRSILLA